MNKSLILLVVALLTLNGCSVKSLRQTNQYPSFIQKTKVIAVMPPDLYINQITAGKQIELMDEWTDHAKEMITEALRESFKDKNGYEIKFIEKDWLKENHKALWKDYSSLYSYPSDQPIWKKFRIDVS